MRIKDCEEECLYLQSPCSDNDVFDLCEILSSEIHVDKPTNAYEATNAYMHLRNEILSLL